VTYSLRDNETWALLIVVFSATGMAQRIFWRQMACDAAPFNTVLPILYRAFDLLARLLDERAEETTVLLASAHGAGPM
jgi:hypothetical protein